jgi:hypothetical protein
MAATIATASPVPAQDEPVQDPVTPVPAKAPRIPVPTRTATVALADKTGDADLPTLVAAAKVAAREVNYGANPTESGLAKYGAKAYAARVAKFGPVLEALNAAIVAAGGEAIALRAVPVAEEPAAE